MSQQDVEDEDDYSMMRKCIIEKLEWCTHDDNDGDTNNNNIQGISSSNKNNKENRKFDLKHQNKGVPIFSVDVQSSQNDGIERFATGMCVV